MLRPFLLTRASIGLAASVVEHAAALPGRTVEAVASLPTVPVRVAGGLVQSYLHAGQTLTALAVKGDRVIASVFPSRSDQPEWATFDEDRADPDDRYGTASPTGGDDDPDDPDVPSGRVAPRAT
ncbi:hypothetical protein [Dietzia sp. UBA5065]|uniref:hypothetical protein n=1 Tax=Dietzia sp. UBA5065 TaxID=1946422 RepID=UPI0025C1350B|nr:hypothetical protein [Dietzia sp. UBA5065]HMT49584.1 hypothetical protein [Dietzia sp.]